MLRQLRLTAERTVTRAGETFQVLTAAPRLENPPFNPYRCTSDTASSLLGDGIA